MLAGVPTPPELAQDRLVLLLPGPLFAFMLEHLLYLGKPLFFAGLLVAQVVLCGLGGLLASGWRRAILVAAGLWLLTGLLLVPFSRGLFGGDIRVALVIGAAAAIYALSLVAFQRQPSALAVAPLAERRQLLGGAVLFLASALLARRVVGVPASGASASSAAPAVAEPPPVPGLPAPVTPPNDFYVVSKNLDDPVVDVASWHLEVAGLVDRPLDLRYDDLLTLPTVEEYRTLECISNEVGGDLMSNGRWTGFRLADLLQAAGLRDAGTSIVFTGVDGYVETMDRARALDPTTLLVYQLDGEPLPAKHGYPLRVLRTGAYGMKNPKWLMRIEVTQEPPQGFWEQQGWDPDAPVATMSRIDTPTDGTTVPGSTVRVAGVAFAADRGIQRVEVSTDGGTSWSDARLLPSQGPSTWTFWELGWQPTQPGQATLVARATDGTGQLQTDRRADSYPRGATGYHTIGVRVGG